MAKNIRISHSGPLYWFPILSLRSRPRSSDSRYIAYYRRIGGENQISVGVDLESTLRLEWTSLLGIVKLRRKGMTYHL